MKNIRLATLAKIIIPLFLICTALIIIIFVFYQSAIQEENEFLNATIQGFGVTLAPHITATLDYVQARSARLYVILVCVIGIFVIIALSSLFVMIYKLAPIRTLVHVAAELSNENTEKNDLVIPNDELGDLTKELVYLLKDINKKSRAKSDFLANMSHEIRTPMNAIIGMTNVAKTSFDVERKDYALEKIEDASNHLLGIINDILEMSKIEADKLVLHSETFVFEDMINKVVDMINFSVVEKKQKLVVDIDEKIPHSIIADDQRLSQTITNLLSNAVKFTPENGTISLNAKLLGEYGRGCEIQFDIADNGVGISDEQQTRLFKPFEQAENSTTRKYGGTGLGLPIASRIIELMGGKISVSSVVGEGSTFTFTVKVEKAADTINDIIPDDNIDAGNLLSESKESESEKIDSYDGYRLLLVEDVDINREIVMALLEPTLLEIDCAENGAEAVRMFSEVPEKYDIIFMDLQMPEMDGFDATRAIRALDDDIAKTIPIVAMTANVFKEDIENCLAAGMNEHIGKPIDLERVLYVLRQYLLHPTEADEETA